MTQGREIGNEYWPHHQYHKTMSEIIQDTLLRNCLDPTPGIEDYLNQVNHAVRKSARHCRAKISPFDFHHMPPTWVPMVGLQQLIIVYNQKTLQHYLAAQQVVSPYMRAIPILVHVKHQKAEYSHDIKDIKYSHTKSHAPQPATIGIFPDPYEAGKNAELLKFELVIGEKE